MRPSLLLSALPLLACASGWDQGWTKPGAGDAELEHARRACLQDSARGRGAGQFGYDQPDRKLFESCMQERGWQREPSQ